MSWRVTYAKPYQLPPSASLPGPPSKQGRCTIMPAEGSVPVYLRTLAASCSHSLAWPFVSFPAQPWFMGGCSELTSVPVHTRHIRCVYVKTESKQ